MNEEKNSGGVGDESPRPALERCSHCNKMVANVYQHTANEECEVVNKEIARLICQGVE